MRRLPTSLRAQLATAALLGIFLIPLTTSSLRGLSHVVTCTEEIAATLTVDTAIGDDTVLLGADTISRDEGPDELCEGLQVDLQLASSTDRRATVLVSVVNGTRHAWEASIELRLDQTDIPVSIGRITAGSTVTDRIELRVSPGQSHQITGTLLVGP